MLWQNSDMKKQRRKKDYVMTEMPEKARNKQKRPHSFILTNFQNILIR